MPPRRQRSSTISSTTPTQPETSTRRPRARRRNSVLDRNLAALRNININVDSSDVSVDPASSPTVTSYSGRRSPVRVPSKSLTGAESEQSEGPFWQNNLSQSPLRRRNGRGEAAGGGLGDGNEGGGEEGRVATSKGSPWTSDDLERLYRTVKMTRVRHPPFIFQ